MSAAHQPDIQLGVAESDGTKGRRISGEGIGQGPIVPKHCHGKKIEEETPNVIERLILN